MSKTKTIKLTSTKTMDNSRLDGWRPVWRVETVTDSIEFAPGDFLEKNIVDSICAALQWKVTIVGEKVEG